MELPCLAVKWFDIDKSKGPGLLILMVWRGEGKEAALTTTQAKPCKCRSKGSRDYRKLIIIHMLTNHIHLNNCTTFTVKMSTLRTFFWKEYIT